jgi:peptidoglycan hydrolase CwlO-like protein
MKMLKKIMFIMILSMVISLSYTDEIKKAKIYDLQNKDQEWRAFKSRHGKNFRSTLHEIKR